LEKSDGTKPLGRPTRWILREEEGVMVFTGFIWIRIRASNLISSCEDGNETSGSIKGCEFLDYMSSY
jgi:hypothetical protein